ncbi:Tripartite ATP-independent periplasmic transporter, DctQ component [Planctomycetes bacterium Poly30]|uniref:Tripartite ATP-independent periplasmic transporter, DctQ component n=1 Tax=Saltatorellus ferox TaxID=2528018 RepID=A0A518EN49_9BACT|nr:Tripartite ATP-independent periplasmic transporter, DctQ component [Planctomycetes bacterium Poly30]
MAFVRIVDRTNAWIGKFAAWLGLLMVLIGAGNAVGGYLEPMVGRKLSLVALDEGQWYLFSLLFLLAAPWALAENAHVRVDVLYGRLGARGKAWTDLVGSLVLLLPFCVFAIVVVTPSAIESFRVREVSPDAGGLVRWPLRIVAPVAFFLIALQGLAGIVRALHVIRRGEASEAEPTHAG